MTCPSWAGSLLMAPDSGQGIRHGIGRYVARNFPYASHSPAATTLHNTGQDSRFSKGATVHKQRKACLRSCQNRVGIRPAPGAIHRVPGGIVLLERRLTYIHQNGKNSGATGRDGIWAIGEGNLDLGDLVLVRVENVSKGSWQPQFFVDRQHKHRH